MVETVELRDVHHLNVGIIKSPAFSAPPPIVRNIDLVPDTILNAMRGGWNAEWFPPRDITVDKVFDVIVTSEGLVFTSDRKLIAQTVTQHSREECERASEIVMNARSIPEISTSCLLMRKRGDSNYGHWLVEVMPKLALARSQCHISGLAIPLVTGPINDVVSDSLALADRIGTTPRFALDSTHATFFKELVIVSGATEHGCYMSPLVVAEVEGLASGILGSGRKRLFVSRRGALRNLANEDAVEEALRADGFHIIHPGTMALREQIGIFRNAEVIVGVMGAGMTSISFSKMGAKVINLSPATMPDTFFYFLSLHKGHDYREIRGANLSSSPSWDELFHIDVEELREEIASR